MDFSKIPSTTTGSTPKQSPKGAPISPTLAALAASASFGPFSAAVGSGNGFFPEFCEMAGNQRDDRRPYFLFPNNFVNVYVFGFQLSLSVSIPCFFFTFFGIFFVFFHLPSAPDKQRAQHSQQECKFVRRITSGLRMFVWRPRGY